VSTLIIEVLGLAPFILVMLITKYFSRLFQENEILEDKRRLTVAITRAKHKLLIIGDMRFLHRYQPFQCLFDCLPSKQVIVLSDGSKSFEWEQLMRNMFTNDISAC
jgi:Superfamily I DNA and RNA helicases and helicase subunits